jgi:signal transduction histidine kinase
MEWQAEELARVSWQMVENHEKIARRFSHELHDELGQALTGLKGIVKRAGDFEAHRAECLTLLDEVLGGVRELSQLLRPVILDDLGLDAGLRWLTERFSQRTRVEVEYSSNVGERLSEPLETHLFRITQEALTNIARHSGATRAWIRLAARRGRIELQIEDNGRGMAESNKRNGSGMGMVGMRARARQVDGELKVDNREGGGLRLQVAAPMRWPDADDAENQDSAR